MVAMEEGWHIATGFLAFIDNRLDDIGSHIGVNHTQQNELVTIGIPERGIGIVTEVGLTNTALLVGILAIHIAAQGRPKEGTVECRVEHGLLLLGTTLYQDMSQLLVPDVISLLAHLLKTLVEHLGLEVLLSIGNAYKRETDFEFQRARSFII